MAMFQVVEKFVSITGEGRRAGELAVFIRMKGCNLSCTYCDTKWANEADACAEEMTEEDIYSYIVKTGVRNVTLTGGEPLWRDDIEVLIERLTRDQRLRVEIETNGSVSLEHFQGFMHRPSFTMDYKCGESGMEDRMCVDNFAYLTELDTVKFVVGSRADMERAEQVIREHGLLERVAIYFSPVFGKINPEEMVQFLMEKRLNDVRIQLQLHKFIWDPDKKGV